MKRQHHKIWLGICLLLTIGIIKMEAQNIVGEDGACGMERPRVAIQENQGSSIRRSIGKKNMAPKGLLILAEFEDLQFNSKNTAIDFDSLANAVNYSYNGATGSVNAYFKAQSNGTYSPHFDIVGPVRLHHTYEYYGTDIDDYNQDMYIADFVIDAVLGADTLGVDFSQYDNDNDGNIDFVYIIYAGKDQAAGGPSTAIWAHNWDLMSALFYGLTNQSEYYYRKTSSGKYESNLPQVDGKTLYEYACSAELIKNGERSGIGTICHEFSHVVGLPDYYISAADATMNKNSTPGAWSIMGYGNYLNNGNTPCNYSAFDKYYLGWATPTLLTYPSQVITLPADGKTYYMITRDGNVPSKGAQTNDTIYYLENRQYTGWDRYLPGHGLLIWQVVYDKTNWEKNTPNCYSTRYGILTANGSTPYVTTHKAGEAQAFPGTNNVTERELFGRTLTNIQEEDGIITLQYGHGEPTGLNEFSAMQEGKIQLEDGRLIVYKNGVRYDVLGRRL